MNKKIEPKDALKVVKDNIHYSMYELKEATKNNTNSRLIRSIRTLDELVDKATPIKPKNQRYDNVHSVGGGVCKCESLVYEFHSFCPNCGQAIDWSEND